MARWSPSYFEAEDIAVRRLIAAHPEDYNRLLAEARAELPGEPCESCSYLGAAALELADLMGHDTLRALHAPGEGASRPAAGRAAARHRTA